MMQRAIIADLVMIVASSQPRAVQTYPRQYIIFCTNTEYSNQDDAED